MLRVSEQKFGRTAQAFSLRRRLRLLAGFPNGHRALDASDIGQSPFGKLRPKLRIVAIAGVSQHDTSGQTSFLCPLDLIQCDLGLGLKHNCGRYASLLSPCLVLGPHFRKIETESHRHAGVLRGHRETHRYPAVLLFADLTAILTRDPD
jgi:hypothetical protein